ncbi:MAG TPA: FAD-linked oxidase C-terminal domain-containing protein [Ktedonobacteraceae bacterium]|jgi:FAD/FMN-containing dehydrogenase/Fe-S oxidoreductase|nr:FAD-linked oxidase C-terminal domain-containing protein [Ktedonobacteraceae bacterium]
MKQEVVANENINTHLKNSNVRGGQMAVSVIDVSGLERDLRGTVSGEVRFDDGSRAMYSTDASNYRQVPIGVVIPRNVDDVIKTVAICHRYGAPIFSRGGGTSLAGQCCNVAVVIDMSKYMNRVIEIDPGKKQARVQPGTILDDLRHQAEHYKLTFGPDPATHNHCTLGGMIGNDSCGTHSVMAGKTVDNIDELDILTYDGLRMRVGKTSDEELERIISEGGRRGEIYARLKDLRDKYADLIRERFPKIPRRVSGYNLDQLLPENGFNVAGALVGTESTCVTVLEAKARLVNSPPARVLLVLGYPDVYSATDHIMEILAHKPIALEGMDGLMIEDAKKKNLLPGDVSLLPSGGGWLLVEFGRDTIQEARNQANGLMEELKKKNNAPDMKLFDKREDEEKIWLVRESALGATGRVPGEKDSWPGWEDSAVPLDKVGDYLRDLRDLLKRYDYRWAFYGHFGQGCIHTRISFDLETGEGIAKFRSFMNEAADLVVKYGGSLSGEHGDGQARAELLPKMYGDELVQAFREFKSIWDPEWKMNPGKMVNAYRMDENLRLRDFHQLPTVTTHFKFPEDGSFARATTRCIGVGKCRRISGGTMCPSFMVTREEADTTRGRARLLFEMLQGSSYPDRQRRSSAATASQSGDLRSNPLEEGWHSEAVKDALDLCLACKGCKGDCPVNVDMATYKAEFLSHYYEGKLRPLSGYSMGLIYRWAGLAAFAPEVVNFFTQAPILSNIVKALGGISQKRSMPKFAPMTFKQWFRQHEPKNVGQQQVLLWPDTFNNHFHPETAIAAVEVLEAAGYQVIVPEQSLCCGRPLYDFGFLDLAQDLLRQILDTLRPQIRAGMSIIGLEPSCVSVFRDELVNLFPDDEDAKRLSQQSFLLSEFLNRKAEHYRPPKLNRKAVVHGHCHHKAIMEMNDEEALLSKIGLDFHVLDSGCCGMAGAFGFEKSHYDVSIKAGERVLLPAVRDAGKETLIIADGFSCREQIEQCTDRKALHVAQVLKMAMDKEKGEFVGRTYPEEEFTKSPSSPLSKIRAAAFIGGGVMLVGGVGVWMWKLLQGDR